MLLYVISMFSESVSVNGDTGVPYIAKYTCDYPKETISIIHWL